MNEKELQAWAHQRMIGLPVCMTADSVTAALMAAYREGYTAGRRSTELPASADIQLSQCYACGMYKAGITVRTCVDMLLLEFSCRCEFCGRQSAWADSRDQAVRLWDQLNGVQR